MTIRKPNRQSLTPAGDSHCIKAAIQSLAYQLWLDKRATLPASDVKWLVDGRLLKQLDDLSRDQLLRVNSVLARWLAGAKPLTMRASN